MGRGTGGWLGIAIGVSVGSPIACRTKNPPPPCHSTTAASLLRSVCFRQACVALVVSGLGPGGSERLVLEARAAAQHI